MKQNSLFWRILVGGDSTKASCATRWWGDVDVGEQDDVADDEEEVVVVALLGMEIGAELAAPPVRGDEEAAAAADEEEEEEKMGEGSGWVSRRRKWAWTT